MSLLEVLDRKLGRYGIPSLSLVLVLGQLLVYGLAQYDPTWRDGLNLTTERLLAGEWWRAVTFLFVPPEYSLIVLLFALYLFELMGRSLERFWGTFRYNAYLLVGWLATVASGFVHPAAQVPNEWLLLSVFLAFAWLAPDFEVLLFFFVPLRIKYIALATWVWYGWAIATGSWATNVVLLASICNYLLFFGTRIWLRVLSNKKRMEYKAALLVEKRAVRHRCTSCEITDVSHPEMDFRYCSQCQERAAYCSEHIHRHEHR